MIQLQKEEFKWVFTPTGDCVTARLGDIQLNQVTGTTFDGGLAQLYLKISEPKEARLVPLIGKQAGASLQISETSLLWRGEIETFRYQVRFQLGTAGRWFYEVQLEGPKDARCEVIYGQDLGVALPAALAANEAYTSQYLDMQAFETELYGIQLTARQNQQQAGNYPFVQLGSLTGARHFSTDGFQFFGCESRWGVEPRIAHEATLADEVYQYELAYGALQSEPLVWDEAGKATVVFYGQMLTTHPNQVVETLPLADIEAEWHELQATVLPSVPVPKVERAPYQILNGEVLNAAQLKQWYPEQFAVETGAEGDMLAFYTAANHHVVLPAKERIVERPHGQIYLTGMPQNTEEPTMATTAYMMGVFQSQIVLGNTSNHQMITNIRNPLNQMHQTGQRIYVKLADTWHLLAEPSAFEMGFNSAKWLYETPTVTLIVELVAAVDQAQTSLTVTVERGAVTAFRLTNELAPERHIERVATTSWRVTTTQAAATMAPDLAYLLTFEDASQVEERAAVCWFTAETAVEAVEDAAFRTWEITSDKGFRLQTQGTLTGAFPELSQLSLQEQQDQFRAYLHELNRGLTFATNDTALLSPFERFNRVVDWYTLDMLIHFLSPHGLEQFSGAAWGTRDVCQGPFEFFLATQHFTHCRQIILTLFRHQFVEDGNWPQWFMFDRYHATMADESHGDVIVWPLKIVADYLEATGDTTILVEVLPYIEKTTGDYTAVSVSLAEHLHKAFGYIEDHYLPGTTLSSYGDGDWDDTLQPANAELKANMASTWTVALTLDALGRLSREVATTDTPFAQRLTATCQAMEHDYRQIMENDNVLPGFILKEGADFHYIIHPEEERTNIDYRLLPMIQSIQSQVSSPAKARFYLDTIREQLFFPDGVHLMNRPAPYAGGVSTYFKRAEQAANFGREIGLQYVHAHIRYSEVLSKVGQAAELLEALGMINPVGLQEQVKNALPRQSNTYFSSSDGAFKTRYEAAANFDKLKTGEQAVKGGWRIYSSGPGIYFYQLASRLAGLRVKHRALVLDPVLPIEAGCVRVHFYYDGLPLDLTVQAGDHEALLINGQEVALDTLSREENPYRQGGLVIPAEQMQALRKEDKWEIIYQQKN